MEAMSETDLEILKAGGAPQTGMMNGDNGRLKVIVMAAKTAAAHKGTILPNEYTQLEEIGINTEGELAEILFVVGMMQGLNQILPNYVNRGAEIEPFLKKAGPFANTAYKDVTVE